MIALATLFVYTVTRIPCAEYANGQCRLALLINKTQKTAVRCCNQHGGYPARPSPSAPNLPNHQVVPSIYLPATLTRAYVRTHVRSLFAGLGLFEHGFCICMARCTTASMFDVVVPVALCGMATALDCGRPAQVAVACCCYCRVDGMGEPLEAPPPHTTPPAPTVPVRLGSGSEVFPLGSFRVLS